MLALLESSPILVLFAVAAAGYLAGKIRIAGVGLGVAAVLFVGLAIGAADPKLALPELVPTLGLVLFVYTVGLASGPGFFASLRKRGLAINGIVAGLLVLGAALAAGLARALGAPAATAAGLFAGALTNTPALASVVEAMKSGGAEGASLAQPVVAYSIAYPFGVIGVLLAMAFGQRRRAKDAPVTVREDEGTLATLTVVVDGERADGKTVSELTATHRLHVVMTRVRKGEDVAVVTGRTRLAAGDLVTMVGAEADLQAAARVLGRVSEEHLELDRHELDFRRMFVSSSEAVGVPLRELRLPERFGAVVTRVRRGDADRLADAELVLELGDRVRVVAPRARMKEVERLFGDSYRALSEVDVITFGLGVALGLLLGSVPVPLPGGSRLSLGLAGGPLVCGLVLGRLGRTGPLVWSLPFSANLTLRQLGLVLFLAGVGTRSGHAFVSTLRSGDGPMLLAAGATITALVAFAAILLARRVLELPVDQALGVLAGLQTQPAALAFALDRTKSDRPNLGYAAVYPLATIAKILLAQLLLALLR